MNRKDILKVILIEEKLLYILNSLFLSLQFDSCIRSNNHHHNQIEQLHQFRKFPCTLYSLYTSLSLCCGQLLICFLSLYFCLYRILCKWNHAVYTYFCLTLALSMMLLRDTHFVVCVYSSFFFLHNMQWYDCITDCLFTCWRKFELFPVSITNKATTNICM